MKGLLAGFALVVGLAAPQVAKAQAWAGQEGQLGVNLSQAFQFSSGVYYGDAGLITDLGTQSLRTSLELELTPIEKLTIGVEGSFALNKYSGLQSLNRPGPGQVQLLGHGDDDDGDFHGSLTDAFINVRYQVLEETIALSPLVRAKIPMTNYENIGYAAAGTGLWEAGGGLAIGKFGLGTPNLFAEAAYVYMIVGKEDVAPETEEFTMNYSEFTGSVGYLLGEKWIVAAGGQLRLTHGGFKLDDLQTAPQVVIDNHDPILSRQLFALNLSGYYQATDNLGLGLAFAAVVWGDNVSDAKILSLSANWTSQVL